MKHIDLYSGIGGFALACEWNDIETIMFCEIDKFCQKVLKKHWPDVPIVEDVNDIEKIKQIITDTELCGRLYRQPEINATDRQQQTQCNTRTIPESSLLLTAGFPCQPFSNAGRKRGADDDRYLWPQTFAVIEAIKPDWIILENVAGLLGMVFPDSEIEMANQTSLFSNEGEAIADYNTIAGRIDSNLKQAGYETVWLVIPACSLGAPHRRDRVWIVANASKIRCRQWGNNRQERYIQGNGGASTQGQSERQGWFSGAIEIIAITQNPDNVRNRGRRDGNKGGSIGSLQTERPDSESTPNASQPGLQGQQSREPVRLSGQCNREWSYEKPGWTENWYEVATRFCRVDDGVPNRVDRLKSLGNAIVPQVAYEIIKSIKESNRLSTTGGENG